MTPDETVDLLTLIAARDRRTVGKMDVIAWQADAGDLNFADAVAAVSLHFRQSTDWLMPKHVRDLVRKIRSERLEGFQYVPEVGDGDPQVYLNRLREQREAVASGRREPAPAIAAPDPERAEAIRRLCAGVFASPPAGA
jgi:hypothetical protein